MAIGMATHSRRSFACIILLSALCTLLPISVAQSQVPTEAVVHIDRAVLAYDAKQYDDALNELKEALRFDPHNVEALYYLGVVYLTLNRPAEGQAALEQALALRPGNADISFQLGVLFFDQQNYEKAEPLLRQVYRVDPDRQNLGYYLGFIEYRKKNYREAIGFLQANKPSDDNFAQLARFYTGLAMSALGLPSQGQAAISEALRLQPGSPLTAPAQRFGEILQTAAQRERFFRGELRLGVYYDSNVSVVPTPSSNVVAQALQGPHASGGELASLNLSYTWLKSLDWEGIASYRFLQTYNNSLPNFNTQDHTPNITVGYKSVVGAMPLIMGSQWAFDFITLGNSKYMQRWIVNPYLTLVENQNSNFANSTTFQFGFQVQDFFNHHPLSVPAEERSGFYYMVGPTHFVVFDEGRHYFKLGYQYDFDDAEGKDWTYAGNRLVTGGQYTLPWWDIRLRYDLDLHWSFYRYDNRVAFETTGKLIKRRDREPIHLFSVSKDFLNNFTGSVEYLFDNNKSNLDAYTYKRHVVTTSITWRF
jgi:tetratricopeptide (TPR) repeat protein